MKQFLDIELNDKSPWQQLCDVVRKANPEAADWLEQNPVSRPRSSTAPVDLNYAFTWSQTPQGYYYWDSLHARLLTRYPEIYPVRTRWE